LPPSVPKGVNSPDVSRHLTSDGFLTKTRPFVESMIVARAYFPWVYYFLLTSTQAASPIQPGFPPKRSKRHNAGVHQRGGSSRPGGKRNPHRLPLPEPGQRPAWCLEVRSPPGLSVLQMLLDHLVGDVSLRILRRVGKDNGSFLFLGGSNCNPPSHCYAVTRSWAVGVTRYPRRGSGRGGAWLCQAGRA